MIEAKNELKIYRTQSEPYKRFGPNNDGGYVYVDDISENDFIISCGIADNNIWHVDKFIGLEKELSENSCGIHMYDISNIEAEDLVENGKFYCENVGTDVSLTEMIKRTGHDGDFILKMDIEGAEWGLFKDADSKDISKFRQIGIELHNLVQRFNSENTYNETIEVLSKINRTHHLVLIQENNCVENLGYVGNLKSPSIIEALFLRKDSYNFVNVDYPENLLQECNENLPEVEFFYRK